MTSDQLKSKLSCKIGTINSEKEQNIMSESTSINNDYLALKNNTIDIIKQNLKNQPLSLHLFDTVKSPSGGSTVFTVPGIAGDEVEKSISGIILDYTTPRAYWENSDPAEGTPLPVSAMTALFHRTEKPAVIVHIMTSVQKTEKAMLKPARNLLHSFCFVPRISCLL